VPFDSSYRVHSIAVTMLTLIENANLYAPQPQGVQSVLIANNKILKLGSLQKEFLKKVDGELEIVSGEGRYLIPGFIDPHQHLIGGSGESGYATQTPEITLTEIVRSGITSVVGVLGTDTSMKNMQGLLGKVKALKQQGLSVYLWSGGYTLPPQTITETIRTDILFIEEIIGVGEVAISDKRAMEPTLTELAKTVKAVYLGGIMSSKSGITHFHVGDGEERLGLLKKLLEDKTFQIEASWLYPTHISRSEKLMEEAIEFTHQGSFVDIDCTNKDLQKWLEFYFDRGGVHSKLTISSDADSSSPLNLFGQIRECVNEHKFNLQIILPLITTNPAEVLKLPTKGKIAEGFDADLLLVRKDSFEIDYLWAGGRAMIKKGEIQVQEKFLEKSDRTIELQGTKK
jgi:beta-aspartyl-dipeptidase (metallo-type)